MGNTNESKTRYKIKLKIPHGETFMDVITCAFFRVPLYSRVSFCMIYINISFVVAQQIKNDLDRNIDLYLDLELYETKWDNNATCIITDSTDERKLFSKSFRCMDIYREHVPNQADANCRVYLFLANPMFYDLEVKNRFNKMYKNKTAFEIIEDYETFLNKLYDKEPFWIHHVGIDDDIKSDYKYEQLLVSTKNDLGILDQIIYNKKPTKDFLIYLFDDFCFDSDCEKPIALHLINYANRSSKDFKKLDILKYFDSLMTLSTIREGTLKDTLQNLTHGVDTFVLKSTKQISEKVIKNSFISTVNPTTDDPKQEVLISDSKDPNNTRVVNLVPNKTSTKKNYIQDKEKSKKSLSIFVPDTSTLAEERINRYRELIEGTIRAITEVQFFDCYIDLCQFGFKYNLDISQTVTANKEEVPLLGSYDFTPLSIINIFYKETEFAMKHMIKSQMIRYYTNDGRTCDNCVHFHPGTESELYSSYCTLHQRPKTKNSSCNDWDDGFGEI